MWSGLRAHAIERAAAGPALGAAWAQQTGYAVVIEQCKAQVAALAAE